MYVSYTAVSVNKTATTQVIHGNVVIDSKPEITTAHVKFTIVAYQFFCNGQTFAASGPNSGNINLLRNPSGAIDPFPSGWQMGAWHDAGDGLVFFHADGTSYIPPAPQPQVGTVHDFQHLAPRILLGCDGNVTGGPFQPGGNITLVWNPLFLLPAI
jgi:hypothetical protein